MSTNHAARLTALQERMAEAGLDLFVVQDPDSIYWLSGHFGYLGMEFGRATLLAVPRSGAPVLITPAMEAEMARHLAAVEDLREWADGVAGEWAGVLSGVIEAQQAALAAIRPGVTAEAVHLAAEEVTRDAGFGPAYRTGRGIGYSFLEEPQLKHGDKTPIEAGMTFAVDGGITIPGEFGARVGDSIVVTESGFEFLTDFPRALTVL